MNATKKATIVCVVMFSLAIGVSAIISHKAEPASGLPEDLYRYYSARADLFEKKAEEDDKNWRQQDVRFDLECANSARRIAREYRDRYNRELSVRLYRDLAILGSAPEANKLYWMEYEARRLQ